jgi:hypothetical protein
MDDIDKTTDMLGQSLEECIETKNKKLVNDVIEVFVTPIMGVIHKLMNEDIVQQLESCDALKEKLYILAKEHFDFSTTAKLGIVSRFGTSILTGGDSEQYFICEIEDAIDKFISVCGATILLAYMLCTNPADYNSHSMQSMTKCAMITLSISLSRLVYRRLFDEFLETIPNEKTEM